MFSKNYFLILIVIFNLIFISALPDDAGNRIDFTYTPVTNYSEVNVNNSDYLDGFDSSYFYPYSNPFSFYNSTNLPPATNPFDQVLNTTSDVQFNKITEDFTSIGARDQIRLDMSIASAGNDIGTIYRGIYSDWDYTTSAGSLVNSAFTWLKLDADITNGGSAFFQPTFKILEASVDSASQVLIDQLINIDIDVTGSSAGNGVFYLNAEDDSPTGNIIATRTVAKITDTTNSLSAIGYQGYAQNSDTTKSGKAIALNPFIASSGGAKAVYWLQATSSGTLPDRERSIFFHSNGVGHGIIDRGGLAITSTSREILNPNPATHVSSWNSTTANGFLYVENDTEIDGTLYADGGINITGDVVISNQNGFTGFCVNTTFVEGIAVSCND